MHAACDFDGNLKQSQGGGYIVETADVGGGQIKPVRTEDKMAKKAAGKANAAAMANAKGTLKKAPKAKAQKGGAPVVTDTAATPREVVPANKREQLKNEVADAVARLTEQAEKADAAVAIAKEELKEARAKANELGRKLRDESKLLSDLVAGRAVPRTLFDN